METTEQPAADQPVTNPRYRVPGHVVFRTFPQETVALNLETGKYHSLNPTGGRMLEVLDRVGDVETAARQLAEEYDRDLDDIRGDLTGLCDALVELKLIEPAPDSR